MLLAGDIGGTKTILALFSPEKGLRKPLREETFPSAQYKSPEDLFSSFLSTAGAPVRRAVLGVAGPVIRGRARITNLPWILDQNRLGKVLNIPSVTLINDLEAIAQAVTVLKPADLRTLNSGTPVPGGAMAVVAPGTGLGEAFLTPDGSGRRDGYRPCASEGGHADFAPRNPLEDELLCWLRRRFSHVSYERICSGLGVREIYRFLKESGRGQEPVWLAEELARTEDPTPVIVRAALKRNPPNRLCLKTLHLFSSILGAEAGNLALKVMATKGVYLGGGIPPAILPLLLKGPFLNAFKAKGRMSDLVARMPVHVITNTRAALLGAAAWGLQRTRR